MLSRGIASDWARHPPNACAYKHTYLLAHTVKPGEGAVRNEASFTVRLHFRLCAYCDLTIVLSR